VFAVEDVMGRAARLGQRVLLLDDSGNWRGAGTAWAMAEQGHHVTLLTPDSMVGREILRTGSEFPMRKRLRSVGVDFITDAAVGEWHGDGATILDLLTGTSKWMAFDTLVLATANVAENGLAHALEGSGLAFHAIGDGLSPRHAAAAIYEGRKLGLGL
jgi:hypothetical protein